jgi:hypothetical protein
MKVGSYTKTTVASSAFVVLLFVFIELSQERKTFLVKEQHPLVNAPKVRGYDTSWCIKFLPHYGCIDS